jgi:transposase-like protein
MAQGGCTVRGRYPSGLETVERAEGSAEAKNRARLILGTISGAYRMREVCAELGISQQRFQQLRDKMMNTFVSSQERRRPGRKRQRASPEAQRIAALEAELAELRRELQTAQTREEIALILGRRGEGSEEDLEKKLNVTTTPAAGKRRGRPSGKRKNT